MTEGAGGTAESTLTGDEAAPRPFGAPGRERRSWLQWKCVT